MKEYWIVDPINKTIQVYKLREDKLYGQAETYLFEDEDKIKVGIFPELEIDLKRVFEACNVPE